MAGCKRCAPKGGNREREKEEKRKGKRGKKWESKSFFFFFFFFFFFKVHAQVFFICAVVIFQMYEENCS